MTRLIIDLDVLNTELSDSTDAVPSRVRILGQVIEYERETSRLIVSSIPNLLEDEVNVSENNQHFKLNVFDVLAELDSEMTYHGCIVDAIGYWDGNEVNVLECHPANAQSILSDGNRDVVREMSSLKGLG